MSDNDQRNSSLAASTVKVAIIGAGPMARHHARAFASIAGVELVGLLSRTRSKALKLAHDFEIPAIYDTVGELHEKTSADIVVVAVSVLAIPSVTEECMQYPWLILAEKPIGLSTEESERVARVVQAKGARVHVALNRRHYSSTLEAERLLEQQSGPRFTHVMDQQDMQAAQKRGHPREVIERFMYANSIHLIDYFTIFCRGAISAIDVVQPWTPRDPSIVIASLQFDSGDIGLYQGVWNGPGPWGVSINQGELRVDLQPLEALSYQVRGSRERTAFERSADDQAYKPGLRKQALQCVALAREEEVSPTVPTIEEGLLTMRLIQQIYDCSNHDFGRNP